MIYLVRHDSDTWGNFEARFAVDNLFLLALGIVYNLA